MQSVVLTISPLAEKRLLVFPLRKLLLGRRAYSDSMRSKKAILDRSSNEDGRGGAKTYTATGETPIERV
jgi:hypothetical protein